MQVCRSNLERGFRHNSRPPAPALSIPVRPAQTPPQAFELHLIQQLAATQQLAVFFLSFFIRYKRQATQPKNPAYTAAASPYAALALAKSRGSVRNATPTYTYARVVVSASPWGSRSAARDQRSFGGRSVGCQPRRNTRDHTHTHTYIAAEKEVATEAQAPRL